MQGGRCFGVHGARAILLWISCTLLLTVGGCSATKVADEALGEATKSLLEKTGLKKPEIKTPEVPQAEALRLPRTVALRVHAGAELNHDTQRQPLSLVVRLYKLKSASAFQQAPYETFVDSAREKQALGDDLVESRELMLVPGQKLEVKEKVPREAAFLGVVALFHSPAPQRWKLVFDAQAAEKTGLVLGAHGCSLTVPHGTPVGAQVDLALVGAVRCGP